MANTNDYQKQLKTLLSAYNKSLIAKLLETTERGVDYWISDNPKIPRAETQRKISELFKRHEIGDRLSEPVQEYKTDPERIDYREKYITSLEERLEETKSRLSEREGVLNSLKADISHVILINHVMLRSLRGSITEIQAKVSGVDPKKLRSRIDIETAEILKGIEKMGNLKDVGIVDT